MLTLLTDIRRFKSSGALPWGAAQGDQDALFWDAVDVVESAHAEILAHANPGAGRV